MEDTELYQCIQRGTKESFKKALDASDKLTDEEIRLRSKEDNGSFIHKIIDVLPSVHKKYGNISFTIPLVYRLAYHGINVNAQNKHGNTCLYLACLKPHADALCIHLIRIGADPCILNTKKCRVIYNHTNQTCQIVKGQEIASSGIWNAVEKEDFATIERLLKCGCRVNVRKNKSLRDVADESGNVEIIKMLRRYETRNEAMCLALACHAERLREFLKASKLGANIYDESSIVAKPLVVLVKELGDISRSTVKVLEEFGAEDPLSYQEKLENAQNAFEASSFYRSVEKGTREGVCEALDALERGEVNIDLRSFRSESEGWTYLHYVVSRMNQTSDEQVRRLLIRAIYKLALADIDVNARNARQETALTMAASRLDQALMTHIIRIGADTSVINPDGKTVYIETYVDKGKLAFDKKYTINDLPGLWVAVEQNDIGKAERWLRTWARVNVKKGDRRLIDVARALDRPEIVRLLEQYEHINEFVTATFACDQKKMMDVIALGKGERKVNTIDDFFHVGYTWDRHAEHVPRPIIVSAIEICTPQVVDFMLQFGANLSIQHDECEPCGPIAFWAFRDHIENDITLVVASHAEVTLRDELGTTMLHCAIKKKQTDGKEEIVQTLLDRGIDVAARDRDGSTARDYLHIHEIEGPDELRQIIDNHVLQMAAEDKVYQVETYMIDSYDHIDDIRGTKKNKTAKEIAHLKGYKEMKIFLDDMHEYRSHIENLHECAKTGDLRTISKLSGEKRVAWGRDKGGRTLLHKAVLYKHEDLVAFLIDQYPQLVHSRDNLQRTPLHYCACYKDRRKIWGLLVNAGNANPHLIDVNNLTPNEYAREIENPTLTRDRPRGRRWYDYRPHNVIEFERMMEYGSKPVCFDVYRRILQALKKGTLQDVKLEAAGFPYRLSDYELDEELLRTCIRHKRQEVAKYLIEHLGARPDLTFKIPSSGKDGEEGEETRISLVEFARTSGLKDLADFAEAKINEKMTMNENGMTQQTNENGVFQQESLPIEQCAE